MEDFYFKIFNSMWTVSFVDKIPLEEYEENKGFLFGRAYSENNKILIATKDSKGNILPETTIRLTVLHEIMHAILIAGQYNSCSDDEPLVEWLANCIYSLLEQKKL